MSKEYFDELEKKQDMCESWKNTEISSLDIKDKKLLEIGYGMGSYHLALARGGAVCHGIDLTEGNQLLLDGIWKLMDFILGY